MPRDPVLQRFDRAFTEAYAFYEADEYEKALEAADRLICEADLPRYHRIKCCLLIAVTVADEEEVRIEGPKPFPWLGHLLTSAFYFGRQMSSYIAPIYSGMLRAPGPISSRVSYLSYTLGGVVSIC